MHACMLRIHEFALHVYSSSDRRLIWSKSEFCMCIVHAIKTRYPYCEAKHTYTWGSTYDGSVALVHMGANRPSLGAITSMYFI